MNSKKQSSKPASRRAALFFIIAIYAVVMPERAPAFARNPLTPRTLTTDEKDADKIFREGKDLLDKEEWAKAAEKFKELISNYPKNKSNAAALYWLAFSYKKQKAYKQTDEALDRLLREFPESAWVADARVLKMEAAAEAAISSRGKTIPQFQDDVESLQRQIEISDPRSDSPAAKTALARQDELRLAAFQSLLVADTKRTLETMGGILKADANASRTLKQAMLRTLSRDRLLNPSRLGQFLILLRETLIEGFQSESNIDTRKEIIYTLASIFDVQSIKYLAGLYATEADKEIKKAILSSFNDSSSNPFISASRINSRVAQIRRIEIEKLIEVLRAEKDVGLRRTAFYTLQRIGVGMQSAGNEPMTINGLIQLYDNEPAIELKILYIRLLKDIKQRQVTKKLLDIAKNDRSEKLRLEAVYALRTSKDPEVISFLEEVIKRQPN